MPEHRPFETNNVLILSDDSEFARLLSSCWRAERRPPALTVLNSQAWKAPDPENYDVIVIGPLVGASVSRILGTLPPAMGVILCAPFDSHEIRQLRTRHPSFV